MRPRQMTNERPMRPIRFLALFVSAGTVSACGQQFQPGNVVDNLRVLAIRAEPPELRPGEAALLSALVADPRGGGRPISLLWGRCQIDGLVNDLLLCRDESRLSPLGAGETASVTAPVDYLTTSPQGPTTRRVLIVGLVAKAGDETRIAFKEILVTGEDVPLNRNPRLTSLAVQRDEAGTPAGPPLGSAEVGAKLRLVATADGALRERYLKDGVDSLEDSQFSWFTTKGELEKNRTFDDEANNLWTTPSQPENVTLWVVLRDGRNGTDWKSVPFDVR